VSPAIPSALNRGKWSTSQTGHFTGRERTQVQIEYDAWWIQQLVWTFRRRKKKPSPCRDSNPGSSRPWILKSDRSSVPCHYLNLDSLAPLPHRFHQHIVEFHHMHCRWQYILQNCGIQIGTGCNDGLKQTENIYIYIYM